MLAVLLLSSQLLAPCAPLLAICPDDPPERRCAHRTGEGWPVIGCEAWREAQTPKPVREENEAERRFCPTGPPERAVRSAPGLSPCAFAEY